MSKRATPHLPDNLTHNQALVLSCLQEAERAMTAYELLDALRPAGLRAPPQIYRALEVLAARELVHRIETLNAYVACRHHDHRAAVAFAICDDCSTIWEFTLPPEQDAASRMADRKGFEVHRQTVELHGSCADCVAYANYKDYTEPPDGQPPRDGSGDEPSHPRFVAGFELEALEEIEDGGEEGEG